MAELQVKNVTHNKTQQLQKPQKFSKSEKVKDFPNDSVEISTKQKTRSKKTKWGIFLGVLGAIGTAALLILRGKFSKAIQLAEHIEFTKANSIEEAIEFGRQHLGIKKYKNFTDKDLDTLNWINEGLTKINNKFKGKTKIPKTIEYIEAEKGIMARVRHNGIRYDSWLGINKSFFENIDNILKNIAFINDKDYELFDETTTKSLKKLMQKYKEGKLTNIEDKIKLFNEIKTLENEKLQSPARFIQEIMKNPEAKQKLIDKGLLYGENHNKYKIFDSFEIDLDKDLYAQTDPRFVETMKKILIKESGYKMKHREQSPYRTIFHEIGHLNDKVRNDDEALTGNVSFFEKIKAWGDNKKDFGTTCSVSDYASTSPGEFVAEVFAELVSGNKLSDEVMKLYKRLGGKLVE